MANIHPTAVVSPETVLGEDVTIGAYSLIKGAVSIGPGTVIHEHSNLQGKTTIGADCKIGPAAYIGLPPQHLHADPEAGELIIGNSVTIRETATVHRSTHAGPEHATRIGDNCFLMGAVHVAHDCVLGESVVMANASLLGGHCRIGERAFLGGGCTLHQHVRVGRLVIIAGNEAVTQEIPPFAAVRYGGLKGYNAVGCHRAGISRQSVHAIRAAYRCLHVHRLTATAVEEIRATVPLMPEVEEILEFLATATRGIAPSVGGRRRVFGPAHDSDGVHSANDSESDSPSLPRQRSAGFPATADRAAIRSTR